MKKNLFRAYNTNWGKMYYNVEEFDNFAEILRGADYIIMQYTGVNDTYGVPLYEGDIVSSTFLKSVRKTSYGVIKFIEGTYIIEEVVSGMIHDLDIDVEVRHEGNIFQDKDILEDD